ncbi:hypothetical protein Tsubulata_043495 [Turnera subulata]|uniref:Uncharacterized protein n=1 Tax=Turnera subulata TaxID=218843 RepID=A0A9Q0G4X6_9ROSI|nr:hypothetical protein Tsubulata_043495 [Turnera subulata]
MKRGDWYRTKDLVLKGTDWIVNEEIWSTWTWWCWFPFRPQMVIHAESL